MMYTIVKILYSLQNVCLYGGSKNICLSGIDQAYLRRFSFLGKLLFLCSNHDCNHCIILYIFITSYELYPFGYIEFSAQRS